MKRSIAVGIVGVGAHLPSEVRTNDWWPREVVSAWNEKRARAREKWGETRPTTDGMARVLAAMASAKDDPFQGAVERRVIATGTKSSDIELLAARDAIQRARIDPQKIGLVLCNSCVPDHLVTNNACLLHHNLGLPARCLSLATEAACNSFILQLSLAEHMVASGQVEYALLVQSCTISELLDHVEPHSPWFGDGATAVVVGKVSNGRGVLGTSHRTDGSRNRTMVGSVPNRRWYDDGRVIMYSADPTSARQSFLEVADEAKDVCDEVLRETGFGAEDVDFFAVHQGTPWLRSVLLEHLGLKNARSVETFKFAASMFGANIPFGMTLGQREGLLKPGDLVLSFSGGAGLTFSAAVMRWGQ
jgi:3-oxoacyl-[acyl-carrier-protein] synthase III